MRLDSLSDLEVGRLLAAAHPRALGRVLRWQEEGKQRAEDVLATLPRVESVARIVGLTGVPGAGKSTLAGKLIGEWRARGMTVGVLAIDPSSPFTGGALLGDRVRMQEHATDSGVFLRSLATRGQLGGLSAATWQCVRTLQHANFDRILVETVGVGQDELDIAQLADCTVVALVPHLGDDIQNLKAGLMEIADVFCVNKMDLPGARSYKHALGVSVRLRNPTERPPVVGVSATRGDGVRSLTDAIEAKLGSLTSEHLASRDLRLFTAELRSTATTLLTRALDEALSEPSLAETIAAKAREGQSPLALLQLALDGTLAALDDKERR